MVKHCALNSPMIQNPVLEGVAVVVSVVVVHRPGGEVTPLAVAGTMTWTVTRIATRTTTVDLTLTTDAVEVVHTTIAHPPGIMIAHLPEIIMIIHRPEIIMIGLLLGIMIARLPEIMIAHLPEIMIVHLPGIITIDHRLETMTVLHHPEITMIDPHPVIMTITENPQPRMMTATLLHNQDGTQ